MPPGGPAQGPARGGQAWAAPREEGPLGYARFLNGELAPLGAWANWE